MAVLLARAPRQLGAPAFVVGGAAIVLGWGVLAQLSSHAGVTEFATMWLAMTVAMMLPSALRPMMRAADGSSARAGAFALGFGAPWLAAGIPAYLLMNAFSWTPFWIAAAWVAAGVYQLTPAVRRSLGDCRSVRFDGVPVRYGFQQGVRCVTSCWPLMIAAMATTMLLPGTFLPLLGLVAVTALVCWEKAPSARPRAIASIGLAMVLVAAGGYVLLGGGGSSPHHSGGTSTS